MRVVQISDIHLMAQSDARLYGVDCGQALQNIVAAINELRTPAELVIATGDLAEDGSQASYQRLQDILSLLQVPVYTLPGNHDDIKTMRCCFTGDQFFCIDTVSEGQWGLVFIHSQVEGHSHGHVSLQEMHKLERAVTQFADSPVLVAMHHTPSMVCPSSGCQLENASEFTELLNKYHNIKCVIAGHTHNVSDLNVGGHWQLTTPSTFAHVTHAQPGELVDHEDFWASHRLDGSRQGFRVLDLFDDGEFSTEVHWLQTTTP